MTSKKTYATTLQDSLAGYGLNANKDFLNTWMSLTPSQNPQQSSDPYAPFGFGFGYGDPLASMATFYQVPYYRKNATTGPGHMVNPGQNPYVNGGSGGGYTPPPATSGGVPPILPTTPVSVPPVQGTTGGTGTSGYYQPPQLMTPPPIGTGADWRNTMAYGI